MNLVQVLADISEWCYKPDIATIQNTVSTIITVIQVAIPVLLIIFGMIDLGKAVVASKEDEIKKGQQTFIKRLIAAAIVFLVIFIVKLIISVLAPDVTAENGNQINKDDVWSCAERFIYGAKSTTTGGGQ